jgi:hypothetical protein
MAFSNSSQSVLTRIRSLVPQATFVANVTSARSKRDTIEDARKKVAEKLVANKNYVLGTSTSAVDPVYKKQADGTYAVGIKYGNRFLTGIFEDGTFVTGVTQESFGALIDELAQIAKEGGFDDAIKQVMQANLDAKKK